MLNLKKQPLISIIINCHNGEKYLKKTIKSVLNQTYKNWEIIFFNNNSEDNSLKIFKTFKDKRIKFYSHNNKFLLPLYKARNLAIKKAKGKYITFLDVDDLWKKNKLTDQLKLSKKFPLVKIFYSNFDILDQASNKSYLKYTYQLPSGFITQRLLNDYCVAILTIFIDKRIFKKYKFNEKFNIIGDFDLIIRLSEKFKIVPEQNSLGYYRIHKNNYSKNIKLFLNEMILWFNKNKKRLQKKNINLFNIRIFIFKLKLKLLLGKIFYYNF